MMSIDASVLNGAIGARVRRERQQRGWTLDQLAAAAALSRRMLVNIEQGEANPSISTLLRLGDALGVGLPTLVAPPDAGAVTITRRGTAPELWSSETGGSALLVAGTQPPDVVELWEWVLATGDRHASDPHAAGTTELLHVLDGRVALEVAGAVHALETGDAAAFPGDVAHAYRNDASAPARFSLAVFEPGVAPSIPRQEFHREG